MRKRAYTVQVWRDDKTLCGEVIISEEPNNLGVALTQSQTRSTALRLCLEAHGIHTAEK
jgi:hypothetical protein